MINSIDISKEKSQREEFSASDLSTHSFIYYLVSYKTISSNIKLPIYSIIDQNSLFQSNQHTKLYLKIND